MNAQQIVTPTVSILIPVYNRKQYLSECIQSALNQTFTDFEIVLVDNASTDGTWELCKQFAARDSRVRIFRNETNLGPVRNWRRCAEEARGRFAKLLFSDDLLLPDCLMVMVAELADPAVSFVYCAARIGDTLETATLAYFSDRVRFSPVQYLAMLVYGDVPASPGAVMIRSTDLLENLHLTFPTSTPRAYDKHGAGPDVMVMLLTGLQYPLVAHVPQALVFFRSHAGSITISNLNNQVTHGYRSALAWFIKKTYGDQYWRDFMIVSWFQSRESTGGWTNPRWFLTEYEGSGTWLELFKVIGASLGYALFRRALKSHRFICVKWGILERFDHRLQPQRM